MPLSPWWEICRMFSATHHLVHDHNSCWECEKGGEQGKGLVAHIIVIRHLLLCNVGDSKQLAFASLHILHLTRLMLLLDIMSKNFSPLSLYFRTTSKCSSKGQRWGLNSAKRTSEGRSQKSLWPSVRAETIQQIREDQESPKQGG